MKDGFGSRLAILFLLCFSYIFLFCTLCRLHGHFSPLVYFTQWTNKKTDCLLSSNIKFTYLGCFIVIWRKSRTTFIVKLYMKVMPRALLYQYNNSFTFVICFLVSITECFEVFSSHLSSCACYGVC